MLQYEEDDAGQQSEVREHPSEGFALSAQAGARRPLHFLPFHGQRDAGVCGKVQCLCSQESGHHHACYLWTPEDRRIRNLNFEFSVKKQTPKYFDCRCLSHEVTCSHVLLPSLPLASQRVLRNMPGKGKTYHQHHNLCRHHRDVCAAEALSQPCSDQQRPQSSYTPHGET